MKSRIVYAAMVTLIACGMAWSQSSNQGTTDSQAPAAQQGSHTDAQGDLPAVKEGESQSGKGASGKPAEEVPGAMGTPTTPDTGMTPKGETPATGSQTEQKGNAADDDSRPGVTPPSSDNKRNMTPNGSDTSDQSVPSYEKPITTSDSNSDTPSQKSTDSGAESPK